MLCVCVSYLCASALKDEEIIIEICSALVEVTPSDHHFIQIVLEHGMITRLCELLLTDSHFIQKSTHVIANFLLVSTPLQNKLILYEFRLRYKPEDNSTVQTTSTTDCFEYFVNFLRHVKEQMMPIWGAQFTALATSSSSSSSSGSLKKYSLIGNLREKNNANVVECIVDVFMTLEGMIPVVFNASNNIIIGRDVLLVSLSECCRQYMAIALGVAVRSMVITAGSL
jgi:hypothetical protein